MSYTQSKELAIGKAGEHIVCADLLINGFDAFLSDQGMPYDLLLDDGVRFYKVQVKTCMKARNVNSQGRTKRIAYNFSVRRKGKKGYSRLSNKDCDIVALVALDISQIAYILIDHAPQTLNLSPPGCNLGHMPAIDQFPISLTFNKKDWFKNFKKIITENSYCRSKRSIARSGLGAKLTEEEVIKIKKLLLAGEKQKTIAKVFNISEQNITSIKKGRSWKHLKI